MVTEDYVSFETAKLLKEKGFDWCESPFYSEQDRDEWRQNNSYTIPNMEYNPDYPFDSEVLTMVAPHVAIQMAMKWLRDIHNLDIIAPPQFDDTKWTYSAIIFKLSVPCTEIRLNDNKDKKEEACEAAIKYCLENLIKNEDEEEESDIPIPKTVNEAISTLEKILSDEDREYLLKNGAISMHNSLGRWIRNEWGLWTGSELKNELRKKGFEHPDDMSNYIIEEFIKHLNNNI